MTEEKKWFEVSEDELMHRQVMDSEVYKKLPKDAVKICDELLDEVMQKLGVNTADKETIAFQCQVMDIFINSIEEPRNVAGIYVSVREGVKIRPYAWIKAPEVDAMGTYIFKPAYFEKIADDFPVPVKVRIG